MSDESPHARGILDTSTVILMEAITDASKDAELVVVGTRGHGAIASLVLGSVSHHVVQHAACPVVTGSGNRSHRKMDDRPVSQRSSTASRPGQS